MPSWRRSRAARRPSRTAVRSSQSASTTNLPDYFEIPQSNRPPALGLQAVLATAYVVQHRHGAVRHLIPLLDQTISFGSVPAHAARSRCGPGNRVTHSVKAAQAARRRSLPGQPSPEGRRQGEVVTPTDRLAVAVEAVQRELRAQRAAGVQGPSTRRALGQRHRTRRDEAAGLSERLRTLADERRRFGYRRLAVLLRREGQAVNLHWVYRLQGSPVQSRSAGPEHRAADRHDGESRCSSVFS